MDKATESLAVKLIFAVIISSTVAQYREECIVWRDVAADIERQPQSDVTCSPNAACTGVDCNGLYRWLHNDYMPAGLSPETDVCFGVMLEPCKSPVRLFLYLIIPETGTHFNTSFTNSTHDYRVPGTSTFAYGARLQGYMDVDMTPRHEPRSPYNFLQIDLKFRMVLHTRLGDVPATPYPIIPDVIVPIPNCNPGIHNNMYMPSTCVAPTNVDPGYFTTTPIPSADKGGACTLNTLNQCPNNALCHASGKTKSAGSCICAPCFKWGHSKTECVQDTNKCDITVTPPIFYPDEPDVQTSGTKKILTIVFATIGTIAVAGALVGFFVIKYRRYQARYGNHTLLDAEDADPETAEPSMAPAVADDDEPPLDIST